LLLSGLVWMPFSPLGCRLLCKNSCCIALRDRVHSRRGSRCCDNRSCISRLCCGVCCCGLP
jgi:hypothetical protein